ncbi:saccharopine dehydrogenase [Streptosporangium oxazolinicum]|uniref:Saccharopine dehydrogenase [NAD(+), L-lysine-forming] n=1 Tax=Streptosporangium oxazolinicum TaxID=909287 RepID=A0ABP8AFH0_9ACTN
MTGTNHLWMRHEEHPTEARAPIAPADARILTADGIAVTVEDSQRRIFPTSDYEAAGCHIVEPGTWPDAPDDHYIIGVKEPAERPVPLRHRHLFFGHAYGGQRDGERLLRRFAEGGGSLLDLEHVTDARGVRVAAFGYWAGYMAAALAVLHSAKRLDPPLRPRSRHALDAALRHPREGTPTALVIGALGRSGRGARDALATAGIETTCWDVEETRHLDRKALLAHDILVNAVATTEPAPPFLTRADLEDPDRRLSVISDVTCDFTSDRNLLPIYDRPTDWHHPVRRLHEGPPPVDLIAIDNLPSLVPREASAAFSADLLPHLRLLGGWTPAWQRCLETFHAAARSHAAVTKETDV